MEAGVISPLFCSAGGSRFGGDMPRRDKIFYGCFYGTFVFFLYVHLALTVLERSRGL